ncbi:hypothetical protein B0E53_02547 [Micromonospora sp. MH33]|uniref:hypothetical protein n=1 Tax=Micromonospora sp. MH33 TaxID=1945509 RepID=UPI000D294E0D|nr:hypothetical protein [Micromonospora sp. MH33]PSK65490.1 hypothetical protein B0E53_02547 [Micromonospora sp. MH33]
MKRVQRLMIAVAALLVLWAGLAYEVSRPQDASGYLRTVLQVAGSAHDAAATGVLVAREQRRQHLTATYAVSAYDDAMKAVAGAQKKLGTEAAPDDASRALRDRLAPLVEAAARALSDAASARDDSALGHAGAALQAAAQQLNELIEDNR